MKANEAPEKVYIEPNLDSIWGMAERSCESEVKYIRTDVFIEKAVSWLKEQDEMVGVSFQEDFLERFKNYMGGE